VAISRKSRSSLSRRSGKTARQVSVAGKSVTGYVDMARAKDEGLDDGARRTPGAASPTDFRTWCEEVLKPAVRSPSR
jgi:hypothetical protein